MTKLLNSILFVVVAVAMIACNKEKNDVKIPTVQPTIQKAPTTNNDSDDSDEGDDSYNPDKSVESNEDDNPEPHEIQEPVQEWINCAGCMGSGQCTYCYGQGHWNFGYGDQDCPVCTDGRCSMCAGRGGHNETHYVTKTVYY